MGMSLTGGPAAWLPAALAGVLVCGVATTALAAPPTAADLQAMQRQLDEMRARLDAMAGVQADPRLAGFQQQLDTMAAQLAEMKAAQTSAASEIATLKAPPAGPAVTATLANGKPGFATADGRFTANLKAIVMLDAGKYFQDDDLGAAVAGRDLNEGANFRRARIGLDGRLFRDFDYSLIYEFGGSGAEDPGRLYEAAITYTALKPLRIKVGAFEPNIGLAAAVSTSQMPLMERPGPAEIARNVAAGDSRVAVQVSGNGLLGDGDGVATRWFASTAFTGNNISTIGSSGSATAQPFDEQTGWIARATVAPFSAKAWQAHLGINYQYVIQPNDAGTGAATRYAVQLRDRPELRLDGTRLIDTGAIDARHASVLGLEGAFQAGPAMIEGEWFRYRIERRTAALPDPRFGGWYVQGSWILTGESRVYNATDSRFDAPKLARVFDPQAGTWGAFELAGRYSVTDLNFHEGAPGVAAAAGAIRGGEQSIWTFGLNWYLNPSMRVMLDYQHVDIDRLNAAGLRIGQTYDAVAARGQLSF